MTNIHLMASRLSRRPLLLAPDAAQSLATRIAALDPALIHEPRKLGFLTRAKRAIVNARQDNGEDVTLAGPEAYEPMWAGEVDAYLEYGLTLKDGVAMLNIDTPLAVNGEDWCGTWFHGYDSIDAALKTAIADDRVKAIFIRMDCPGGVVSGGIDAVTQTMRENREAAGGKPIWVFADFCASAAYWIAAQADRIVAPREGIVGSIGAVIVHMEGSRHYEKEGVTITPIQFGAQKTAGADFQALDEEARADMQAWVDQCGRNFVGAVSEGRPVLTEQSLLATEARIFMGDHDEPERSGLALKFVDEVMGEADCFAALVDHITPASIADAPAAPVASTQKETEMSKVKPGAQKRASGRPRSQILASMAKAQKQIEDDQDDLEALEDEELADAEEIDSLPDAEEDADKQGKKANEEDLTAEDEDPIPEGEGEEDPIPAGEDEKPADKEMLAGALINFAPDMKAAARSLAGQKGMTFALGKKTLTALRKDARLAGRKDHKISGVGGGKSADAQSARIDAATSKINERRAKARKLR